MNDSHKIRPGTPDDIPRVWELMCELAEYEGEQHRVKTTPAQFLADGFGERPLFGVLVAESDSEIVGTAIHYFRYSTWEGKQLYLEDLIVTEKARGRGIGRALLNATLEMARETHCTGAMWQVLNWNKSAIAFYETFGARFDGEWTNVHLEF